MSNENQETIADIVATMRNESHAGDESCLEWVGDKMRTYADRIEAAAKRECEATSEKSSQVGNAAKMREALERIRKELIYDSCRRTITKFHDIICEVSYSALSAPPRNCDLYRTKKELDAAYEKYREYVIMSNSNPFVAKDEMMTKEDWLFAEAKGEKK